MPVRFHLLISAALLSATAALGQSCAADLGRAADRQVGHLVSAHDLAAPPVAWRHVEKARVALDAHRAELAEAEARQALAIAPRFGQAWLLRAAVALNSGHAEEALALLGTARSFDPGLVWGSVTAASALNALGRFDQAAAEIRNARSGEAATWQAGYELARAETGLHNIAAALHWSEVAVAVAPIGCTAARLVRANALALAGRPAAAVTELETYLDEDRLNDRHPAVLAAIARVRAALPAPAPPSLHDTSLVAMK